MNPAIVQIAVFLLAILSVGGIVGAALYPLLAGESRQKKRLQSITTSRNMSDRRAAADENRRKRNVEEAVKELEEQQKATARKGARPSLTLRTRQAGLSWSRNFYLGVSIAVVFLPELGSPWLMGGWAIVWIFWLVRKE